MKLIAKRNRNIKSLATSSYKKLFIAMVGLIPRLVLDEDEVSKIIHDAYNDEHKSNYERTKSNNSERSEKGEDDGMNKTTGESILLSIIQKSSLPRLNTNPENCTDKVRNIMVTLRRWLRAAPNNTIQLFMDLPDQASNIMGSMLLLPKKVRNSIATGAVNCKNTLMNSISRMANSIKDLPHRATFQWRHLLLVLTIMILCPLLGEVVFFFPMNPVDNGPSENHVFIYGIMTFYQLGWQVPWLETCNFAMPQVDIPVRARIFALIAGLAMAKMIDLVLTLGIFTYEPIFPIPFSIIVTGTAGVLPAVPILYFMTPRRQRKMGNFGLMFLLLLAYWVALLVVIGWAIGIQRLHGKALQYLVLFSYAFLRFICKVIICANISTRLQPKRHVQLNLVVDVLFTRVQVATWPFIDSPFTLIALFASESSVIIWRYYNGVDRIQLWWGAIMTTVSQDQNQEDISRRRKMKGITEACFTKSNKYIINASLSEDKEDIVRTLTTCTTSSTLDTSFSTISNTSETYHDETGFCESKKVLDELPCESNLNVQEGNIFRESFSTTNSTMEVFDDDQDCHIACDKADLESGSSKRRDVIAPIYDTDEDNTTDDFSMELAIRRNGLTGIIRRSKRDINSKVSDDKHDEIDNSVDNFVDVNLLDQSPQESPKETWEQRDLYHMVDSTGSLCVNIIVRINQQLIFIAIRNLPSSEHLNESFQISEERWKEAQIYGSMYITLMLLLTIGINFSSVFFSKKQGLEGKKLSLGRILSYLFKENFWFFFFWLISTGIIVSSAMVNHFGADFSMNFGYLGCLDDMEWPGCKLEV